MDKWLSFGNVFTPVSNNMVIRQACIVCLSALLCSDASLIPTAAERQASAYFSVSGAPAPLYGTKQISLVSANNSAHHTDWLPSSRSPGLSRGIAAPESAGSTIQTSSSTPRHSPAIDENTVIMVSIIGGCVLLTVVAVVVAAVCARVVGSKSAAVTRSPTRSSDSPGLTSTLSQLYNGKRSVPVTDSFYEHAGPGVFANQDDIFTMSMGRQRDTLEMLPLPAPRHAKSVLYEGSPEEQLASAEHLYRFYDNLSMAEEHGYSGRPQSEAWRLVTNQGNRQSGLSEDRISGLSLYQYPHGRVSRTMSHAEHVPVPYRDLASRASMRAEEGRWGRLLDDSHVIEVSTSCRRHSSQGEAVGSDSDIAIDPRLEPGVVIIYTGDQYA